MSERISRCQGCGAELVVPDDGKARPPRKWCSERCRKQTLYSRPCVDCGKRLNGSNGRGPNAPSRCVDCAVPVSAASRTVWTREKVIAAIHAWAAERGEAPAVPDWSPYHARRSCNDEARARRFEEADGRWPWFTIVVSRFGSWSAAMVAAGYEPRANDGTAGTGRHRPRVTA